MSAAEPDAAGARRDGTRALPVIERASAGGRAHAIADAEATLIEAEERNARPDPEPVALDEDERELLESELAAVDATSSPERRRVYEALGRAVRRGRVPVELVPLLERVVAVSLESGRARRRHLAEGEKVLTDLFRRLPTGRELTDVLKGVNRALEVLEDRTVTGVKVGLRTLGHFRIAVATEEVKLTLSVRSRSVAVESLAVKG